MQAIKQSTDATQAPRALLHPLDLLFDRAATLAQRSRDGSLPFIEAVDMAYSAAEFAGLVDSYGDDEVQKVLAEAFADGRA